MQNVKKMPKNVSLKTAKIHYEELVMKLKNFKNHFMKICKHKKHVFLNCCAAGLYWRGIVHDMSKFSPCEFLESARYYQGDSSPINVCKMENGYSNAWLHHKGRNRHHYEYWQDNFDKGGIPLKMPFKDALEMVCDYIAAGQAYRGEAFTYEDEYYVWWKNKISRPIAMHPQTKLFIDMMLFKMAKEGNNHVLRKKRAKAIYDIAENTYKDK